MANQVIHTENAPAAIGPYSQAVKAGNLLFVSGQVPFVADFSNVVKTTVFIKDMNEFAQINEVYAEYFGENKPARACVEVARLPKDVKVEIELIAVL